jgi:putative aldouronate transport system substrate-binding protein
MSRTLSTVMLMILCAAVAFATGNPERGSDGAVPVSQGPLGSYEPELTVRLVASEGSAQRYFPGDSMENNVWTRRVREDLGINVVYDWVVKTEQYEEKLNVTIASNLLPDIFYVTANQFKQLVEADVLADLSEPLDEYAIPLVQERLTFDGGMGLNTAMYDGRLLGLPRSGMPSRDGLPALWIRKDWLEAVGMDPPTTMEELRELSTAFTTEDPNRSGSDDTFGLGITKDLYSGAFDIEAFAQGFRAYPKMWIERDGQLVYGSIQPEMKEALAALQAMYERGELDREFGVKGADKVAEDAGRDRIGMQFGAFWNPFWPLGDVYRTTGGMWGAYPIPSVDDRPAVPAMNAQIQSYWVVRRDFSNPEALIKMMNHYVSLLDGAPMEVYNEYHLGEMTDEDGNLIQTNTFAVAPVGLGNQEGNIHNFRAATAALESGDTSQLSVTELQLFNELSGWMQGDENFWPQWTAFNPTDGSMAVVLRYVDAGTWKLNAFHDTPTDTMAERMPTLHRRELEVFTRIIMGAPLSEFDAFVDQWNELGGSQITREVNEWREQRSQ